MPFIIGGAVLGGAAISGLGSYLGGQQQASAAQGAAGLQGGMYQTNLGLLSPYRDVGGKALSTLQGELGLAGDPNSPAFNSLNRPFSLSDFQASPAYQFNLQQGQLALDKAANARGNYYAPQTLQDVSRFSQGLASNEFMNAYNMYNQNQANQFNRLYTLAGAGQNAAVQQGGFGQAAAGNIGNFGIQGANAQAAGTMGVTNALSGGLQNAYNAYQGAQNTQQLNQILANLQAGQNQFNTPSGNAWWQGQQSPSAWSVG